MPQLRYKHKVGDRFSVAGTYPNGAGGPLDLTVAEMTIRSQVKLGSRRWPLECDILDQALFPGMFQVNGDTSTWPADEELEWDIQFERAGVPQSTVTILITTIPDVTL